MMQSLGYDETGSNGQACRETTPAHPKRQKIRKLAAVQSSSAAAWPVPFPGRDANFGMADRGLRSGGSRPGFCSFRAQAGAAPRALPGKPPPPDNRAPSQLFPCAAPGQENERDFLFFFF